MARSKIKVYYILPRGNTKTPTDDYEETKEREVTATLKMINKIAYNELIIPQEDTICFHIFE